MKTIIAGSRQGITFEEVKKAIQSCPWASKITIILSGTAHGVDRLGELYAFENNITVEKYPADWKAHGKSAGYLRNVEMAKNADALIAIWDGTSPGTKHMIDIARDLGLRVWLNTKKEEEVKSKYILPSREDNVKKGFDISKQQRGSSKYKGASTRLSR